MKKRIYLWAGLLSVLLLAIYSCNQTLENASVSDEQLETNLSKASLSRRIDSVEPFATPGGEIKLAESQIHDIYSIIGLNDFQNLRSYILYTVGIEKDNSDINIDNLKAISIFHYKDGKLEHSFYKKNFNNTYENITYLTSFCTGGSMSEVNFSIYYSDLFKNNTNLSVYSVVKNEREFISSNNLLEKRAITLGRIISLDKQLSQEENDVLLKLYDSRRPCCEEQIPEPPKPGEGPQEPTDDFIDPPLCRMSYAQSTLGSDYISYFNQNIAYEIRDKVLKQSIFGMKYYEYYYKTSFNDCNIDYNDAVKIAVLLPKIYKLYSDFINKKNNEVIFDNDMRDEIINLIESLKTKNASNENLIAIFNDVEEDTRFLSGKTIGQLYEILY